MVPVKLYVNCGLAAAVLVACGTTAPVPSESSSAEAVTKTAVPPSAPPVSLVSEIGERITNIPTLTYSVTSIEVDGRCPGPTIPSSKGHLVVVGLDVQTDPGFTSENARWILSPYGRAGWSIIGPDGITQTGLTSSATYICADSQIPQVMAPNQRYVYKLAFDTTYTTGTIEYRVESVVSRWKY